MARPSHAKGRKVKGGKTESHRKDAKKGEEEARELLTQSKRKEQHEEKSDRL